MLQVVSDMAMMLMVMALVAVTLLLQKAKNQIKKCELFRLKSISCLLFAAIIHSTNTL